MQLISNNFKKGEAKVKITTLEDLWQLTYIIDPKDLVTSRTIRKIKLTKSDSDNVKIIKKPALITIEAEKLDLTESSLRVSGKIKESSNEDISKGSYHTLDIELNSIVGIKKPNEFYSFQILKINDSCRPIMPKILICTLDREEASFALLKQSGYELLSELQGEVEKKAEKQNTSPFYPEIIKIIQQYNERYKLQNIILASPAFWKEDLYRELEKKAPELKQKIILATCNSVGIQAVDEVLKRDELQKALQQDRILKETKLVEQILEKISKKGNCTYGLKETEEAASYGAVETLLITDKLIKELRENNKYEQLDNILRSVDSSKGNIFIISTDHAAGKKLQGLTGIAAILRYSIK